MAETSEDTVLTEDHGPVRVLTLNRPRVLNAVSPQLAQELGAALAGIDPDPDIQVAIITGAGDRAFCAGADLKAMRGTGPSMGEDGAGVIACNAPLSVAESKRMINEGAGLAEDDAWLLSEAAFQRIKDSADALEGPRAFAEKRPPKWQGRLADQVVPQVADVDPEVAAAG